MKESQKTCGLFQFHLSTAIILSFAVPFGLLVIFKLVSLATSKRPLPDGFAEKLTLFQLRHLEASIRSDHIDHPVVDWVSMADRNGVIPSVELQRYLERDPIQKSKVQRSLDGWDHEPRITESISGDRIVIRLQSFRPNGIDDHFGRDDLYTEISFSRSCVDTEAERSDEFCNWYDMTFESPEIGHVPHKME